MSASRRVEFHDVVLRLLDHQLVGPDGTLLGNVDDLELVSRGDTWLVTGIMVGPAALSQRLPGHLGDWLYAVWRRLHPAENPSPVVLPIEHVLSIDSAVHVDDPATHALSLTFGLELWLREYVIGRLPGANVSGDEQDRPRSDKSGAERGRLVVPPTPARAPLEDARGLSSVIGRQVLDAGGDRAGRVSDVRCSGRPRDEQQWPLQVERVLYTPHLAGSELGYSVDRDQGPALVRRFVRTWQRRDRIVDVAQIEGLDEPEGDLRLTTSAQPRHPHDV